MKLTIGTEIEEVGEVESIQLSKGTDDNWRLYLKKGKKTHHFNLDKVLKGQGINQQNVERLVDDMAKHIKPTPDFSKVHQWGNYRRMTDGSDESFEISKSILMKQMQKFIPEPFRNLVVWIKHHWEPHTIKVKDDNYEMFGLAKDKIGTTFTVPEHWTLGWKYTPEAKS